MKEILPNWTFISGDSMRFDENLVKNAKGVVICIKDISHSFYYRIMNARGTNQKIHYLNFNSNTQICLEHLKNME